MRFTIRDLLWLMALVAMALAWWVDRTKIRLACLDRDERLHCLADYLWDAPAADGKLMQEGVLYIVPPKGGKPILVWKEPWVKDSN